MISATTIVTATYDRPRLLREVIRTVLCQTVQDWRWIIVGDACAEATGEMIAAFGDPRITYVNLPQRFGEQAGPNTVGLSLADTPLVAFLNHDDLWLPDHLETGLAALHAAGSDLCLTRAAFLGPRGPASAHRSAFGEQSPPGRDIGDAYEAPFHLVEPLSAWIGTREFFHRLGPMRLATTLAVQPIRDWAMRAARLGARVATPEAVTVLKPYLRASYDGDAPDLNRLATLIETGRIDEIREQIADDLWLSAQLGAARPWQSPQATETPPGHGAAIDRRCGLNRASLDEAARRRPGAILGQALRRRTGETLGRQPDLAEAIAHARQLLD